MNYSSPSDITSDFSKSAVQKTQQPFAKQVIYSIIGGAFVSMGGLLAIIVAGGMPEVAAANPGITRFIFGAVFPVGLIMILIGGAQLFTSDCAVLPYGYLNGKLSLKKLLQVWSTVYFSNFIGAAMIAYFFAYKAEVLTAEPWKTFTINLATLKTTAPFLKIFIKAIGANWLVCMAVWMAYAAKDVTGKILAIWFPVMCFVVLGLEHSIANMFFIPVAMLFGAPISWYDFMISNLVPATLGNIAGGVVFVALYYWFIFNHGVKKEFLHDEPVKKSGHSKAFKNFEKSLN